LFVIITPFISLQYHFVITTYFYYFSLDISLKLQTSDSVGDGGLDANGTFCSLKKEHPLLDNSFPYTLLLIWLFLIICFLH